MSLPLNGAWELVTNQSLRCSLPSLPLSLPIGLAFRNTRPLRPEGKSGARRTYSWWRRTRVFTKITEMCGEKTEESDRGSQGSPGFSIAMQVVDGYCRMSEIRNITIFYLYEVLGKCSFHLVLLHNSVTLSINCC